MKEPACEATTPDHLAGAQETQLEFGSGTPEVEMMCSQVRLLLMASLSFTAMVGVSSSSTPRKRTPTEHLPAEPIEEKVSSSL